jgi:hypothetical protein
MNTNRCTRLHRVRRGWRHRARRGWKRCRRRLRITCSAARRAEAFLRAGGTPPPERLLRDVAGALARRQAREPCARVLIELGRLLLARGRAGDAARVFARLERPRARQAPRACASKPRCGKSQR